MFRPSELLLCWRQPFLRLLLPCFLLAFLMCPALGQTPEPVYNITAIGTLGGQASVGVGINASGQVTGWSDDAAGHRHAFIYTPGASGLLDLGTLGGDDSYGTSINASGQVTGWAARADGSYRAFLYTPGATPAMIEIGSLGGQSYGNSINDSGWVTGWSDLTATYHAFVYDPGTGTMLDITPDDENGQGRGINASGWIAGSRGPTGTAHAFLYRGGAMFDLGTYAGGFTQALAINALGQIAGWGDTQTGVHALLYDSATGWVDIDPTGYRSQAVAINGCGQVVGESDGRGFFYSPQTGLKYLDQLLPEGSGWFPKATAINDAGQITGFDDHTGVPRAFVLTPTSSSYACTPPVTQPLFPGGGTANFGFADNLYNIAFRYPAGFASEGSTLTVVPLPTSPAAWASRTAGTPYEGTVLAPITGEDNGIVYRAICKDAAGMSCAEPALAYDVKTSWEGPAPADPFAAGFLKAPLNSNNWENVLVAFSADRIDPTSSGRSTGGFSDWAVVYNVENYADANISIAAPANDETFLLNERVPAAYSCTGESVLACLGDVANGQGISTDSVGAKAFTVVATVKRGRSVAATSNYSVKYDVKLLYDTGKSVKAGAAYPIKFYLADANGNNVSNPGIIVHASSINQISIETSDEFVAGNANPDNDFRFSADVYPGGGYIFNLKTTGLGGTYNLNFSVFGEAAGTPHSAAFQVR